MYNLDRMAVAIKDTEDFFKKLEETKNGKSTLKEKEDTIRFHAASMMCLTIINRAIDLGSEILVKQPVSMPHRYQEIFSLLAREGIISKELGAEMEELAEHRNYLAHEYFGMDDKRMARVLRKINSVKDFIERVKKIVAKAERKT